MIMMMMMIHNVIMCVANFPLVGSELLHSQALPAVIVFSLYSKEV